MVLSLALTSDAAARSSRRACCTGVAYCAAGFGEPPRAGRVQFRVTNSRSIRVRSKLRRSTVHLDLATSPEDALMARRKKPHSHRPNRRPSSPFWQGQLLANPAKGPYDVHGTWKITVV